MSMEARGSRYMSKEARPDRMVALFDEIFEFVSSHAETREATRLRLSEGLRERIRVRESLPESDVDEFLRIRFAQAFPRTASLYASRLVDKVREAFRAWMEYVESVGDYLKRAGLDWETVEEAANVFLGGPEAIRAFMAEKPSRFVELNRAASVAMATAYFNIYTIPVCLRSVFPYVDPERAGDYVREARRASSLIALAHVKKMYDTGSWDHLALRRLNLVRRLIEL